MGAPGSDMKGYRRTLLRMFLEEPAKSRHFTEIWRATGITNGTLHPILRKMTADGWVSATREPKLQPGVKRHGPQRVFYRLTPLGIQKARQILGHSPTITTGSG
jgi:DNA-binding PadR family transcriptional regulator